MIATQQLIDIVIKASDKASKIADQVDKKMKGLGNNTAKANEKATRSAYEFDKALINTSNNLQLVGGGAVQAANALHMMKMDPKIGSSVDKARLKVSQMGIGLDTVKGKLLVFKNASVMAFDNLKNKVSNAASSIKGKLTGALDKVRMKLEQAGAGATSFRDKLSGLKGIMENALGNVVYDFAMGIFQMAKASINAASQLEYFGQRLNRMDGNVKLSKQGFEDFKQSLDGLQKQFRKIDMTSVGATAEELAVKMKLPSQELGNLTRMTAVLSSTLVKEGHTQEDSVLAVSDALDGQFMRLKEIGIGQEQLMANGWSGDINDKTGLIKALNKTLDEMGFTQTAMDITTVDEAISALQIAMGQLLQKILVPMTPLIIGLVDGLLKVTDAIGGVISAVGGMPDWAKVGLGVAALGLAIAGVSTAMKLGMIPTLAELLAPLAAATAEAWAFAAALLANPLTWVAIALAAVAVAVYEVGKSFGWWTDVNSMLEAVWAGINRLWSAFVNHPDVQGFIKSLIPVWNWLSNAVMGVVKWVQSFFQNTGGQKFDFVRALIDGLGAAWKAMTLPIRTVITVVKLLWTAIQQWYLKTKARVELVKAIFRALPNAIRGLLSGLVNILTAPFKNAIGGVRSAIDTIKSVVKGITNVDISAVTSKLTQPFTDAYNRIVKEVDKIKAQAKSIPVIGGYFGGVDLAYGGVDLPELVTSRNDDLNVNMNQNLNISLDLENVPDGIDQELLHQVVVNTITNRDVINQLVSSNDFQMIDNRVKAKMISRNNRARGV